MSMHGLAFRSQLFCLLRIAFRLGRGGTVRTSVDLVCLPMIVTGLMGTLFQYRSECVAVACVTVREMVAALKMECWGNHT